MLLDDNPGSSQLQDQLAVVTGPGVVLGTISPSEDNDFLLPHWCSLVAF